MIDLMKLSKRTLAINIGACTLIVMGGISFVHKTFARPYVQVCSTRYSRQISMQLERGGAPLAASDLEAFANGQDEGVMDNLSIAQFTEGPVKFAMGIKLAQGTGAQRAAHTIAGGVSLPWMPVSMEQPHAACLSYNVLLPKEFEFGGGGTLPGLFATTAGAPYADSTHVAANLSWREEGRPAFYIESRDSSTVSSADFDTYTGTLPVGRWVHVDQEVILNTPGKRDGTVRLWFDGQLESEIKGADLTANKDVSIAGVAGDVFFGGSGTGGTATKDAVVWLSPFEMRWN